MATTADGNLSPALTTVPKLLLEKFYLI